MANECPKIKLGFLSDGLSINNKRFHPLSTHIQGVELESEERARPIYADVVLDSLIEVSSVNTGKASTTDRIGILKDLINNTSNI